MNTITLYVDKLINNDCIGLTNDSKTIAFNNTKIGTAFVDELTSGLTEDDSFGSVGYIGRYLFSVEISLDKKEYKMAFVDVEQDELLANTIANGLSSEWAKKKFMEHFYLQQPSYKKNYHFVVLVAGKPY